ncbi:SufS family cysteine desulfurase [Conexibacter sp. W3-3-2]|uniref:SufS family cysteine desulfurase n=1 Tax=Conexibacter sp. W3-3-2 TaxID=2675227 RepID=UPI0012B92367|nr:SufS family cysteine desulfurase [Conexibacter sp. W3-3-2]MTD46685.1 SufS family cysteine desulfurase [Conexibacter sp. W3-3-2]
MALAADRPAASDFPTLDREGVVYLDSAATSQTHRAAIAAMDAYYEQHRASVHRGVYRIAVEATELYEGARERVAAWLNTSARSTVFTKNASEAINLVAYAWGGANVGPGDTVVVTEMEHHSNLVPWQLLCERSGATFAYVPIDDEGRLQLDELDRLLQTGTVKVVAVAHVSNVLGTINPVADIVARAHAAGAIAVVDGTQAVPQLPVDVAALGADFYVWTGHKAYGPTGIGILHADPAVLEATPPFLGGGHMISNVTLDGSRWAEIPAKFEAGTSPIAEAAGLGAAIAYLQDLGMDTLRAHELDVTAYALERLRTVPGLTIDGPADAADRGALVSFTLDCAHPHDVAEIVARRGVCVRAGHHCAQPLMQRLGVAATTRASFAIHTTRDDVDQLVTALGDVVDLFGD